MEEIRGEKWRNILRKVRQEKKRREKETPNLKKETVNAGLHL